jgi:hypothetical protein
MQSSTDTTHVLRGDASLNQVVSHPIQREVVPMQYLADTTLVLRGDVSLDDVFSHHIELVVEEVITPM